MTQSNFSNEKGYYSEPGQYPEVFEAEVSRDISDILASTTRSLEREQHRVLNQYREFLRTFLGENSKVGERRRRIAIQNSDDMINAVLESVAGLREGQPITASESSLFLITPIHSRDQPTINALPIGSELHGEIGRLKTKSIATQHTVYSPDDIPLGTREILTDELCLVFDNPTIVTSNGESLEIGIRFEIAVSLQDATLDLREGLAREPGVHDSRIHWIGYSALQVKDIHTT